MTKRGKKNEGRSPGELQLQLRVGVRFSVRFSRLLMKFGSWKMGTDRFQKNLGTEHFGSRLFRFGSGSNRTNRIFLEDLRTTINIPVVRQIYATLCSFFIIIMYKKQ